jgi:FAD/FMN-containing dehydrogenase
MTVALAGGRRIRAGGRVVKNVAGYDLCKLFTGSHGTLGVILELTFKLRPRPRREATLVARSTDLGALAGAARTLAASQLLPVAVELLSPTMSEAVGLEEGGGSFLMLARFAGTEAAVEYQLARAAELFAGASKAGAVERAEDDEELWARLSAARPRGERGLVWRACVLPSALGATLSRLGADSERGRALMWHAGAGDGRLRVFDSTHDEANDDALATLRSVRDAAREAGGSLVVERAPSWLACEFDVWGLTDSAALLMSRVKQQLDPADTFSPGRYRLDPPRQMP